MAGTANEPELIDLTEFSPPSNERQTSIKADEQQSKPTVACTPSASVNNPYKRTKLDCGTKFGTPSPSMNGFQASQSSSGSASIKNAYAGTNASDSSSKVIHNPYRKKFVGGAEAARRKARAAPVPIARPGSETVLSKKMNPFERFFAALLQSPASDYLGAATSDAKAMKLWENICRRVDLSVPTQPIKPVYDNPLSHFNVRAALVLEEARNSVSQALQSTWNKRQTPLYVTAHRTEPSQTYTKVTFVSTRKYTKQELFNIRPGALFQCIPRDQHRVIQNAYLGVVVSSNRDQIEKQNSFACLFFNSNIPQDAECSMTYITFLTTEQRSFESMGNPSVGFLQSLLGNKNGAHTRFDDDENKKDKKSDNTKTLPDYFNPQPQPPENRLFKIPELNKVQEQAATSFLDSKPNTITLVQGPPGTGKTTLLVAIICRYLLESPKEERQCRLMVSAPTNKAISVLASRYLASIKDDSTFNAILVGDGDKLMTDERSNNDRNDQDGQLKSIFLYSWIQSVVDGYNRIKAYFLPYFRGRETVSSLCRLAKQLQKRISNSLPWVNRELDPYTSSVTKALVSLEAGGAAHDIVTLIERVVKVLRDLPQEQVSQQLLSTAHVIFCTLASAGGAVLKKTQRINDLIVDEAAAATEPEICIPFHLQPKRLLAVGDPLQLPATVLSRRAADLGLTKSLHERLMYECGFDHIMLNVQYRMSVQISAFPSARFYDSKIGNGASVSTNEYLSGPILLDKLPYTFLQVEGTEEQSHGGSYCNHLEAKKITELASHLQHHSSNSTNAWHSTERIRVITFYQAQVALIKRCLNERGLGNKIVVATVDSSQGCEADIVLISFVRSPSSRDTRPSAGFLTDNRRMNVALTRAKYQLICVGNVHSFRRMEGAETLHMLAADAEERGVIRTPLLAENNVNSRLDMFYGHLQRPHKKPRKSR